MRKSCLRWAVAACALALAWPAAAQEKKPAERKPAAKAPAPAAADPKAMQEAWEKAAAPGENHKLLASVVGEWTAQNKMWMDPSAPPVDSTGSATFTPIMGGRYVQGEYKAQMMGAPFEGVGVTGYDNLSKRFVTSWIDNMGTGILVLTGDYDPATKTFTYRGEMDDVLVPKTKVKVRETIKIVGPDTHVMEWYENRGGKEAKTMEITYTRKQQ